MAQAVTVPVLLHHTAVDGAGANGPRTMDHRVHLPIRIRPALADLQKSARPGLHTVLARDTAHHGR